MAVVAEPGSVEPSAAGFGVGGRAELGPSTLLGGNAGVGRQEMEERAQYAGAAFGSWSGAVANGRINFEGTFGT